MNNGIRRKVTFIYQRRVEIVEVDSLLNSQLKELLFWHFLWNVYLDIFSFFVLKSNRNSTLLPVRVRVKQTLTVRVLSSSEHSLLVWPSPPQLKHFSGSGQSALECPSLPHLKHPREAPPDASPVIKFVINRAISNVNFTTSSLGRIRTVSLRVALFATVKAPFWLGWIRTFCLRVAFFATIEASSWFGWRRAILLRMPFLHITREPWALKKKTERAQTHLSTIKAASTLSSITAIRLNRSRWSRPFIVIPRVIHFGFSQSRQNTSQKSGSIAVSENNLRRREQRQRNFGSLIQE